jgi:hypothetical protein
MKTNSALIRAIAEAIIQLNDVPYETKQNIATLLNQTEKEPREKFIEPAPEEVEQIFFEYNVLNPRDNAIKFTTFYGSKGWMVGKNKMKSWKLAAIRWALDLPKAVAKAPIV